MQSIALSIATANGYGRHMKELADSQLNSMMKSQYAANILFMISVCLSKLAMITFVRGLSVAALDRRFALGLEIFVAIWAVVGVFGMAFTCHVPHTWDYLNQQCFNTVNISLNIMAGTFADRTDGVVYLPRGYQHSLGDRYTRPGNPHYYSNQDQCPEKVPPG